MMPVLGLIALVPAALNITIAAPDILLLSLCSGDAQVRSIEIPSGPPKAPVQQCAKGCHAGVGRKKVDRNKPLA